MAEFGGVEDFHFAPEHDTVEAPVEIEGGFGIFLPELDAKGAVVGSEIKGVVVFEVFFVPIHGLDGGVAVFVNGAGIGEVGRIDDFLSALIHNLGLAQIY